MSHHNDMIRARDDGRSEVAKPGLSQGLRQDLCPILRHDLCPVLRQDLRPVLRHDLRHDLRQDLRQDLHFDLRHGLRHNLRRNLTPGLHQDLRHILRHDLREDLRRARPDTRPEARPTSRPEARPEASPAAAPDVRQKSHRRQVAPLRVTVNEAEEWVECLEAADRRVQVSATRIAPREESPDRYGLGRHLAEQPKEAPRRRVRSVALIAKREGRVSDYDPADYEDVWTRPARRRH